MLIAKIQNYLLMSLFLKKLTFVKVINFFYVCYEYFMFVVFKKVKRNSFPFSVSIEPTNNCNLHCPQCSTGLKILKRPKGQIDFDLFKTAINQSNKYLLNLFLYYQGEPLLNKSIFEMIEYANSKGVFTSISTNAMLIDNTIAKRLVLSGLDQIIISFDGIDNETYAKYRIGSNLQQVKDAVYFLLKTKRDFSRKNPKIILQFLVNKFNENQIHEFKTFSKKMKVNYQIKSMQIIDFKTIETYLPIQKKYARYKFIENKWKLRRKLKNRCFRIWNSAVICWNGDVLPCCYDKDATYCLGNIKKEDFFRIKSNENFEKFAKKIRANIEEIDICRNCDL